MKPVGGAKSPWSVKLLYLHFIESDPAAFPGLSFDSFDKRLRTPFKSILISGIEGQWRFKFIL